MLIQSVKIKNFRGVQEQKEFEFKGKPFVLLSAPNGLGKTTLIDAVEWCLTGNISRLRNAFDARSTNNEERKKNVDGILKNKKAPNDAEIEVVLEILVGDKAYVIRRIQTKDELNEKFSKVSINNSEKLADKLLPQIADKNFYNFHYCDVQKSIEIQNKKRKDLPDLFSEFITDYSREISVADNLELFMEDTERYRRDMEKEKISAERIETLEKGLKEYKDTPVIQPYPETRIYGAEQIMISELDRKQMKAQLEALFKCGYQCAAMFLGEIIEDEEAREAKRYLMDISIILETKEEQIKEAIKQNLHTGTQKI